MVEELFSELYSKGIDIIKTVDITTLSSKENRGYQTAILIGVALSPPYIHRLSVENVLDHSEFLEKEQLTDHLADWTAEYIIQKGYDSFSQSEKNLNKHELFDEGEKKTPLPHKKIAVMAGLGWIGKNNLLVTEDYGCALSMCSILTKAPIPKVESKLIIPLCGDCTTCKDLCPAGVIHGTTWRVGIDRDRIVDVYHCDQCLKCLAYCPWTQRYMYKNLKKHSL